MNGRGPKVLLPWQIFLESQDDGDNDKDSVYSVKNFLGVLGMRTLWQW